MFTQALVTEKGYDACLLEDEFEDLKDFWYFHHLIVYSDYVPHLKSSFIYLLLSNWKDIPSRMVYIRRTGH